MKESLAIITVVYESHEATQDFLRSLEKQSNQNFHLFLADLSKNKKRLKTDIPMTILPSTNNGYAHGVNVGLKKALGEGFEYFCVINNDTYFNNDFVEKTILSILHHPSSILGGKIYYAPGYEYHKNRYQKSDLGKVFWYAGGQVDWDNVFTPHRGIDRVDEGQYDRFEKTDFITGCLVVFDKEVIKRVGLWDESYFLYFEDADYDEKAKRKGINLYYDPSIVIWHKNAQSTGGAGSSLHQRYQERNRLKFGLKYAPLKTRLYLIKNYLIKQFKR
ncbi:hypothetical protein COS31_05175 [Candidatus Roizmanbacteria bacterium CG02_land_8_20_14_3_00_36_15]|uniref:Glycosyltransferase 2-like domain-containing protein n=1 Tax=Candidatus Roizmanbacteria bacterium CG10_big_fil_rev_8_21_14_0_10_36_26 TaxID=1974851 RepID=A0A2M8KK37_9BACT|nr:MAG: hypothetical protein COS51_02375 [Candidatus Roizmanbacteria bacterium CG03_land_8_20_14_0_80_36_21]PIV37323.1 MAG: hypothetical protein COS31_05175 [Candidatus Roizmanbacteria bacterium CG02_land_8_20_14_3_00_36_15]PIY69779.1 MAG: hypothetical protein COY89_04665 [Candidatus Roizmanbacteria bacterium CG_4_10_14_0_8_um_filter_36_36]PJA53152.1 MAG: hypothetical protein CO166_02775 [Candidatus Roizmanbacteria bacterium CG_4_9_14_3_um_filter_36_11]PJE60286.1 MAG: hypothetical protein COU86